MAKYNLELSTLSSNIPLYLYSSRLNTENSFYYIKTPITKN